MEDPANILNKQKIAQIEGLIKKDDYKGALDILGESTLSSFREKYLKVLALEGARRYEDAVRILEKLSNEKPENINLIMKKGRMEEFLGRIDNAVESYDKVLFFDPFNHFAKERLNNIKSSGKGREESQFKPAQKEGKEIEEKDEEIGESKKTEIEFDRVDIKDHAIGEFKISGSQPGDKTSETSREGSKSVAEYVEKADNIELERDNGAIPPEEPESRRSEGVEGMINEDIDAFLHQDEGKKVPPPTQAKAFPEEQPVESKSRDPEYGFVTRSAAELYEKQGLLDEAMTVYEKLSKQSEDPGEYNKDIQRVRKNMVSVKIIQRLEELKRVLKKGAPSV